MAHWAVMEKPNWWLIVTTKSDKVKTGDSVVMLGHKELNEDQISFSNHITIKDKDGKNIRVYKVVKGN